MTSPNEDEVRLQRRASDLEKLHALLAVDDGVGTDRPEAERHGKFTGPIGLNDDGTRVRELTAAERQHKADVLAGRKAPGSPIEDSPA